MFYEKLKHVSRKLKRRVQECFKDHSRKFQGPFKQVSGGFKRVSRIFQGCSLEVSKKFHVA